MKSIKLLRKIKLCDLNNIKGLIASFEFEIDNNPESWRFEIYTINKYINSWKDLLIEELIESTNKVFNSMNKFEDFCPITIDFNYLSSLFWSPRFGLKLSRNFKKWN